jgi:hypothetical protein
MIKKILAAIVLGVALCDLKFLQSSTPNPHKWGVTRKCHEKMTDGPCVGLHPPATLCGWKPGKGHGVCMRQDENGDWTNVFDFEAHN